MSSASVMLENAEIRARVAPVTVEQYHRFPEFEDGGKRTELIRGILIEKMSKSPLHSSIARRLFMLLQGAMPPGFILLREDPSRSRIPNRSRIWPLFAAKNRTSRLLILRRLNW